jgi:hypothetical protein
MYSKDHCLISQSANPLNYIVKITIFSDCVNKSKLEMLTKKSRVKGMVLLLECLVQGSVQEKLPFLIFVFRLLIILSV